MKTLKFLMLGITAALLISCEADQDEPSIYGKWEFYGRQPTISSQGKSLVNDQMVDYSCGKDFLDLKLNKKADWVTYRGCDRYIDSGTWAKHDDVLEFRGIEEGGTFIIEFVDGNTLKLTERYENANRVQAPTIYLLKRTFVKRVGA